MPCFFAAISAPVPNNYMSSDRRLGVWLDVLNDPCPFGVAFCYVAGAFRASFKCVRHSLVGIGSLASGTSMPELRTGFLSPPLGTRFEKRGLLAGRTGRIRLANHAAQLGEALGQGHDRKNGNFRTNSKIARASDSENPAPTRLRTDSRGKLASMCCMEAN